MTGLAFDLVSAGVGHHTRQEDSWPRDKEKTTSMPALPAPVPPQPADANSAEILFRIGVPGGEQEGEPAALATKARKPRLLPW
jgi:hypothetical protein